LNHIIICWLLFMYNKMRNEDFQSLRMRSYTYAIAVDYAATLAAARASKSFSAMSKSSGVVTLRFS